MSEVAISFDFAEERSNCQPALTNVSWFENLEGYRDVHCNQEPGVCKRFRQFEKYFPRNSNFQPLNFASTKHIKDLALHREEVQDFSIREEKTNEWTCFSLSFLPWSEQCFKKLRCAHLT